MYNSVKNYLVIFLNIFYSIYIMNDFIHAFILYPNRNKLHYYYYLPDEEPEINDNV